MGRNPWGRRCLVDGGCGVRDELTGALGGWFGKWLESPRVALAA